MTKVCKYFFKEQNEILELKDAIAKAKSHE